MKVEFEGKWGDKVSYEDNPEVHKKVFEYLMENYFKKYNCFFGEGIMQSDDPQIYAPQVMANIADDIVKFEISYEDE